MALDQSLEQARPVPVENAADAIPGADPGPAEARRIFSAAGLESPGEYGVAVAPSAGSPGMERSGDR